MSAIKTEPIGTDRLVLLPLRVEHAEAMAAVLGNPDSRTSPGGGPTSRDLRSLYARMLAAPPDPAMSRCAWVIQLREGASLTGSVRATISPSHHKRVAEIDWVIGIDWLRQDIAVEAVEGVIAWLKQQPVRTVIVRAYDEVSAAVAAAAGLSPTGQGDEEDEEVWRLKLRRHA